MMKKWETFLWKHGFLSNDRLTELTPEQSHGVQKKVAFICALVVALGLAWYARELVVEFPKCVYMAKVVVVE